MHGIDCIVLIVVGDIVALCGGAAAVIAQARTAKADAVGWQAVEASLAENKAINAALNSHIIGAALKHLAPPPSLLMSSSATTAVRRLPLMSSPPAARLPSC